MFDVDKNGQLSVEDIVAKFAELGEVISPSEARDMIKVADKTKDTFIEFSEFVRFMMYDTEDQSV